MRKREQYNEAILILQQLHKEYPSYNLGRHLSTALSEYTDLWGVTDVEIVHSLKRYQAELQIDSNVPHSITEEQSELDKILYDGEHLLDDIDSEDEEEF